ncbi:hypothetical protein PoB_001717800 [Plakobranchus ocellatus]|uniref:Uncharacterized protein n=1 Tax=Plakobranchus ocellatus TaxID=259542 RepID=A0AAV3Z7S0_9GAST|nr:hypothetical protein PoB_001717800 [Plakobranchus ocellatus]
MRVGSNLGPSEVRDRSFSEPPEIGRSIPRQRRRFPSVGKLYAMTKVHKANWPLVLVNLFPPLSAAAAIRLAGLHREICMPFKQLTLIVSADQETGKMLSLRLLYCG